MKLKFLFFATVLFPVLVFAQKNSSLDLINKKAGYDLLRDSSRLKIQVLVRMEHDTALYVINDAEFPDTGIATTMNILRDKSGKILLISVYPFSESGDWFVGFTHYFDEQGNTFAFERLTSFYNSGCTNDMATETIVKYYDSDFKEMNNTYSLTGPNDIPLKKSKCDMLYDFPFTVCKTRKDFLIEHHIPLSLE
ncbi:MAG: hypothetical protein WCI97_00825 [Bacteroidota bacterium]